MILTGTEVRYRKFYCTRHTFITETIRGGENIKAVADYCGTSLEMIQRDYCARLELSSLNNRTVLAPEIRNSVDYLASPTGFELESTQNPDEAEEPDVIDISKLKKGDD